ncbi:MAG: glutamyl-tRNA reductase, partial [Myxococcota bacterium]
MRDANQPFDLCVFGMSYRSAPFELLEQAALSGDRLEKFYALLGESGVVRDAFVVSTCNRTEIYASGDLEPAALRGLLREAYETCTIALPEDGSAYSLSGTAALEHLYRVSSGLDSMMLGENQIVGQIKSAYEQGAGRFPTSSHFDRVMQGAFRAATRARAETQIASGAVSVASAAVHLASRIFSDMSGRTVVVLGAGETGRLAAQHFAKHRPKKLVVLNRTVAKAQA